MNNNFIENQDFTNETMPKKKNMLAIIAIIAGIVTCFLNPLGLFSVATIVVSILALRQIKQSGENGKGFAITGLVLGIINLVYFMFLLFAISVLFQV